MTATAAAHAPQSVHRMHRSALQHASAPALALAGWLPVIAQFSVCMFGIMANLKSV